MDSGMNGLDSRRHHREGDQKDDSHSEVETLVTSLANNVSAKDDVPSFLNSCVDTLRSLRSVLVDSSVKKQSQDAFRRCGGFEALLQVLRDVGTDYKAFDLLGDTQGLFFPFLKAFFESLSGALADHTGNQKYFWSKFTPNGWVALQEAMSSAGVEDILQDSTDAFSDSSKESVFGILFSFLLMDENATTMFRMNYEDPHPPENENRDPSALSAGGVTNTPPKKESFGVDSFNHFAIKTRVVTTIGPTAFAWNADIAPTIFSYWLILARAGKPSNTRTSSLLYAVIVSLQHLASLSEYNTCVLHSTGLLELILKALQTLSLPEEEMTCLRGLFLRLMRLGMPDTSDVSSLVVAAKRSEVTSQLLLDAIDASDEPAHFLFDLSLHGSAAIEFSDIKGAFPPAQPAEGYTFMTWLRVENFDKTCHTTIFGAFDVTQTCFILVYIERESQQLVLQTSVTAAKPSIRFKSARFEKGRWYHIAIVHRRPRGDSPSLARLIVDGKFCEETKCDFPKSATPTISKSRPTDPSSANIRTPIQAFLGTPHDLSPRLGTGVLVSRWSLASAYVLGEALSEELILVYQKLGPSYQGTFQDCLGSFQTYSSSARLNLINESHLSGKTGDSVIATAIRSKAGRFNPQQNCLLNVSALNTLKHSDAQNQFVQYKALKDSLERYGGNEIVVNGASPHILDALKRTYGPGILTGGSILCQTCPLSNSTWRLAGFVPLALKMVEDASTPQALLLSIKILFRLLSNDWRNSEAMERDNGYGMLAWLLRNKLNVSKKDQEQTEPLEIELEQLEFLKQNVLNLVLEFVGFDAGRPKESLIVNPLAYRVLLIDCDIWRRADITTQGIYYDQFTVFGLTSRHKTFNVKRLERMRIMKKLLDALKGESIRKPTLPILMEALKTILKCTISADVLRSLALFTTYSLHRLDLVPVSHTDHRPRSKDQLDEYRQGFLSSRSGSSGRASPVTRVVSNEQSISRFDLGIALLEMLTEMLTGDLSETIIRRFGKTVTNKWLLHLLAVDDSRVVICGARILSRMLVVCGSTYTARFDENAKGFTIMCDRLRKWWDLDEIWTCCFCMLFGVDIAQINMNQPFDGNTLLRTLTTEGNFEPKYPKVLTIITSMLEESMTSVTSEQVTNLHVKESNLHGWKPGVHSTELHRKAIDLLHSVLGYLSKLYMDCAAFQELASRHGFIKELLKLLSPMLVPLPQVDLLAEELGLQASENSSARWDMKQRPHVEDFDDMQNEMENEELVTLKQSRASRRSSSFVIVKSGHLPGEHARTFAKPLAPEITDSKARDIEPDLRQKMLDFIATIQVDQILLNKDFTGLGLFLKAPPGPMKYRAVLTSQVMKTTLAQLGSRIHETPRLFHEPRALSNICKFVQQSCEAVFEGWFIDGEKLLMSLVAEVLMYLERPEVQTIKSVRLCSPTIFSLRAVFRRLALLRVSISLQHTDQSDERLLTLSELVEWQGPLFSHDDQDVIWLSALCFLVHRFLVEDPEPCRLAAAELWCRMMKHKPEELLEILTDSSQERSRQVGLDFANLLRDGSPKALLEWTEKFQNDLIFVFSGRPQSFYWQMVDDENEKSEARAKSRAVKRVERLQQLHLQDLAVSHAETEHKTTTRNWSENIFNSESLKHQRARQDHLDNRNFVEDMYRKQQKQFERLGILEDPPATLKWQLDGTEARDRMRLRLSPTENTNEILYRPKRAATENIIQPDSRAETPDSSRRRAISTVSQRSKDTRLSGAQATPLLQYPSEEPSLTVDDDFEVVPNSNPEEDEIEDKNRKVMRSLQRGEQVEEVFNVSRVRGLEACACLLIVGKKGLYFQDNLFQRTDGEITNIEQVPRKERDPYTETLLGLGTPAIAGNFRGESEVRYWQWAEVISISKRHFLLRDVAMEIFFEDGRSYLLTVPTTKQRDAVFKILSDRAYIFQETRSQSESAWRQNFLQNPGDSAQSLGSKFARVFNASSSIPATKRWLKGEMSNFRYLMAINTMAGRTFNDLTQYPVFPWVLADYTSEELDLNDSRVFRDLTKPMGCQTPEREVAFRERYKTFADMSDENTPAFHYGTHYSSAMIVTSFLIRLQPFVHSYLLLQGGRFDHADRLFHSIEKAWLSASRETMTDVRELTPEFFFLPDFLVNLNGYNFGAKEGSGEVVNDVKLPPWAKNDPTIFIAKHREALESPYVTENLHSWIDLVFGIKQRGEAALEATNVFHHLSYSGAKDLDSIEDDLERQATIGIIHNFGQTPQQLFSRPHDAREVSTLPADRLPLDFDSFQMTPAPILELRKPVSRLMTVSKQQKVSACGTFQTFLRPDLLVLAEWGYADRGIRFYSADRKKMLGLFEQLHQGQISTVLPVSDKALVTTSTDCTITIWSVTGTSDTVEIHARGSLFGHRAAILVSTAARSFGTLLTCSTDCVVYMWDLQRLSLLRKLDVPEPVTCADMNDENGHVLLCFGTRAIMYTLNGRKLLDQWLGHGSDEITSCAFFYGAPDQWNGSEIVFTGHKNGTVGIWQVHVSIGGEWQLHLVRKLHHIDRPRGIDRTFGVPISSILSLEKKLYTGDVNGKIVSNPSSKSVGGLYRTLTRLLKSSNGTACVERRARITALLETVLRLGGTTGAKLYPQWGLNIKEQSHGIDESLFNILTVPFIHPGISWRQRLSVSLPDYLKT